MTPEFVYDRLRYAGREAPVGLVVYRLLLSLFSAYPGSRSIADVGEYVWGETPSPGMLFSACQRARDVLRRLKHPLRVSVDGGRVVLL